MNQLMIIATDLAAVAVLTFGVYFPRHHRRDLVIAFLGVNVGVLAVSMVLSSSTVGLGLGLGLFGVPSIIRLRSDETAASSTCRSSSSTWSTTPPWPRSATWPATRRFRRRAYVHEVLANALIHPARLRFVPVLMSSNRLDWRSTSAGGRPDSRLGGINPKTLGISPYGSTSPVSAPTASGVS
ncbi:DUF4956 domain-containing protein [Nonomuraea sp. NBC_00507]|uniref:DUF4956 domain-containing protein n=1 Tax=Nonomuraea sp. NBC_00507 TaxID=2976002 RepID=UPI002E1857FA